MPATSQAKSRTALRTWTFRVFALLIGLLLCEGILSLTAALSPRVQYHLSPPWERVVVPDTLLGHRMSPYYPGNDESGFRNAAVPDSCGILAIGDSCTYGYAAAPSKSWPRQLETLCGQSAYNMSCGGYGPCEYSALLDRGLALKPTVVLIGVHPGNDFSGAFRSAYVDRRFPEAQSRDERVLHQLRVASQNGPLRGTEAGLVPSLAMRTATGGLWVWISDHSSVYAILRELRFRLGNGGYTSPFREDEPPQDTFELAAARPGRIPFCGNEGCRTVFLDPSFFASSMAVTDPRIAEGFRIACESLVQMHERCGTQRRCIIVIIPTKNMVYEHLVAATESDFPEKFHSAVDHERQITIALERFLSENAIEYVNTTKSLRGALAMGGRPYPQSDDMHPNAMGYAAIARVVAERLAANEPPTR
jgi:hypothetical protein